MFLLTAMGPPGGGRTVISRRLQSRFNLINMTFPQVSMYIHIHLHVHVLNYHVYYEDQWDINSNSVLFDLYSVGYFII